MKGISKITLRFLIILMIVIPFIHIDSNSASAAGGTIIVEKQTDPDSDPQSFTFTGDAAGSISDDGQITVSDLVPGTYTSTETEPSGWDLTAIDCTSGGSYDLGTKTATFVIVAEETVTCTFTNTKRGTIIVEKQTVPDGDPQNFAFTGDAAGSIADGGQITVNNLEPDTYTSVETVPTDWNLTTISCDDGNSTGNTSSRTATLRLEAGETVTCIFTNTKGDNTDPVIDIWYGSTQKFGNIGMPQGQIGILGNVSDNGTIDSLTYSLNGGPELALSIGPDGRRLDEQGDFVVEIFDGDLNVGSNSVEITATDTFSNTTTETVTVNYQRENIWPFGTTDWSTTSDIQDLAQVVDGDWVLSGGLKTENPGYDRLVAIGDVSWTDYEATVPITIHGIEAPGPFSDVPAVGLMLRWTGHTDYPISGRQPKTGWEPFGAITWYRWITGAERLQIWGNSGEVIADDISGMKLTIGETYNFKVRAEGFTYKFRVWEDGDPEPTTWNIQGTGGQTDYGSFMLFAHHVNATFGDVTVVDLSGGAPPASTIVSDDFEYCTLDTDRWTFVDPVGDSSTNFTGAFTPNAYLNISVPAGSDHDIHPLPTGNLAARVMQSANDTDFQVTAKFVSGVSQRYSMQGILVEEDADTFVRAEFYSDGTQTLMFTGAYSGTEWITHANTGIGMNDESPLYLRLKREGARWMASSSTDGSVWTLVSSFPAGIAVNKIGVHVANAQGTNSPAHTGTFDYFYNDASPGAGDGVAQPLTIHTVGSGTVTADPTGGYTCDDTVTLTANPSTDWGFDGWSGDLTGNINPDTITINGPEVVTATFKLEYTLTVNEVGNGTVTVDPIKDPYLDGDEVTLTATADAGSTFSGWSGDLSSNDNPATLTITKDTSVTATFTQDVYTLTVNKVGNGTVVVIPSKSTYHYGDQVTLTATGDSGWGFTGWSGDLSGNTNPTTLTITGNTSVIATFTEGVYTLTVIEVGSGTVVVNPSKTTYQNGDQVTLTATADPGWTFSGWSGDLSGSSNPATLTITADTTVTATFTPKEYTMTVNIVGKGKVTVSPDKPTYQHGEIVTLTATADPGWIFVNWKTDTDTITSNPLTGPMDSDVSITAYFFDGNYQIYLPIVSYSD